MCHVCNYRTTIPKALLKNKFMHELFVDGQKPENA
jgi:hypothetical protein